MRTLRSFERPLLEAKFGGRNLCTRDELGIRSWLVGSDQLTELGHVSGPINSVGIGHSLLAYSVARSLEVVIADTTGKKKVAFDYPVLWDPWLFPILDGFVVGRVEVFWVVRLQPNDIEVRRYDESNFPYLWHTFNVRGVVERESAIDIHVYGCPTDHEDGVVRVGPNGVEKWLRAPSPTGAAHSRRRFEVHAEVVADQRTECSLETLEDHIFYHPPPGVTKSPFEIDLRLTSFAQSLAYVRTTEITLTFPAHLDKRPSPIRTLAARDSRGRLWVAMDRFLHVERESTFDLHYEFDSRPILLEPTDTGLLAVTPSEVLSFDLSAN